MKIAVILILLFGAGWLYYAWSNRPTPAPNAAERYTSALSSDVKRADEAKAKADAAMKVMDDRVKDMQKAEQSGDGSETK